MQVDWAERALAIRVVWSLLASTLRWRERRRLHATWLSFWVPRCRSERRAEHVLGLTSWRDGALFSSESKRLFIPRLRLQTQCLKRLLNTKGSDQDLNPSVEAALRAEKEGILPLSQGKKASHSYWFLIIPRCEFDDNNLHLVSLFRWFCSSNCHELVIVRAISCRPVNLQLLVRNPLPSPTSLDNSRCKLLRIFCTSVDGDGGKKTHDNEVKLR